MEVDISLSSERMLNLKLDFDDLVDDYALQLIEALKRKLSVLDEMPKVVDNIDKVISTIRLANTPKDAEDSLVKLLGINPLTAKRVLKMSLSKLTGLTAEDVRQEKESIVSSIRAIQ